MAVRGAAVDDLQVGSAFSALGPFGGAMEVGLLDDDGPRDLVMVKPGA